MQRPLQDRIIPELAGVGRSTGPAPLERDAARGAGGACARAFPVSRHQVAGRGVADLHLRHPGCQLRPDAGLRGYHFVRPYHVLRHRRLRSGHYAGQGLGRLGRGDARRGRRRRAGGDGRRRHRGSEPARARHLLLDDYAGDRELRRDRGGAMARSHRRGGRADLLGPACPDAGLPAVRRSAAGRQRHRHRADLLPDVHRVAGAVSGHAADRQLAVRPGAAGDPRERIPRRGDGLPGRRLPDASYARCRPSWRRWPAC